MSRRPQQALPENRAGLWVLSWMLAALLLVIPFWLFLTELGSAQRQHRINRSYQPVTATVRSACVTSFTGSRGAVHYVPEVQYQYEVDGKTYQSDKLMALSAWGTEAWANAVVAKYKAGEPCTAFFDPQYPGQAVLLKRYSFQPYFGLIEVAFILAGGSFMILSLWFGRKRAPAPADNGWFEIKPGNGERARLFTAVVCTILWYGLGAVPAVHYFLCVPPPHAARSLNFFLGFALLGLIPLGLMIRYLVMCRDMDEARLLLDQPAAMLGRRFKFALTQRAKRQLLMKEVRVRLLCIGTKAQGRSRVRRTLHDATAVELNDHTLHAGEGLELSGELTPPANLRPTGRDATGEVDWINWELRLECGVVRASDYEVSFPLEVQALPFEEPALAAGEKPGALVEVRPIDPEFAGRILTKRTLLTGSLIGLATLPAMLLGIAMMVSVFPVIFPDKSGLHPFLNLPLPQAILLFAGGAVLTLVTAVQGILFPSVFSERYFRRLANKSVGRRRDAIVLPGTDSVFVEIVPRANWNRMMLQNAADIGFLTVDVHRGEIRFEGDKERYRVPAGALRSCTLEKSLLTAAARPDAPGIWLVVIRAYGESGIWEAPVALRLNGSAIYRTKKRKKAAEALLAKIKALLPAA